MAGIQTNIKSPGGGYTSGNAGFTQLASGKLLEFLFNQNPLLLLAAGVIILFFRETLFSVLIGLLMSLLPGKRELALAAIVGLLLLHYNILG